jgi:anti-sigma factor RsiW
MYLDHELEGNELNTFEAHLVDCVQCQAIFKHERRFLETIRQLRPLHTASDELKDRARAIIQQPAESSVAPAPAKSGIRQVRNQPRVWAVAAAATLVMLIIPAGLWLIRPNHQNASGGPSTFALMAADTHLRHTRGQLPLEVVSDSGDKLSAWFVNKVSFEVKLPHYQDSSGQEKLYRLEGARLVSYKDDYAAYVAYEMKLRPISLVITSETLAEATGGEEIKARGLTFHYNAIDGLKVLTWSDRGLTYALVSDLDERGQQSCVVCHQGAKDRDFIDPLKPR